MDQGIKIERTIQQEYVLRKIAWSKLEQRYWIFAAVLSVIGIEIAFSKSSINGSPLERDKFSIAIGALIVGFAIANIVLVLRSKKSIIQGD